MRQTKALHQRNDIVTLSLADDDLLYSLDGLRARITGLYWEETAWGYTIEPFEDLDSDRARLMAHVMFHDTDLAA